MPSNKPAPRATDAAGQAARGGYRAMLVFFLPLAVAQVLQTLRDPILDAGISRGLDPVNSLAAFGVMGSLVNFLGAAGLVIQSAFFVLVQGRESYRFMRRYAAVYISLILLLAGLLAAPGVGPVFLRHAIGVSPELLPDVAALARISLAIPALNIVRLFFLAELAYRRQIVVLWLVPAAAQALLVALAMGMIPNVPLSAGVAGMAAWLTVTTLEAVTLGFFASRTSAHTPYPPDPAGERRLSVASVTGFALPLILTQFSLAASQPMMNAGLLRLTNPETAVAGYRVASSIVALTIGALASVRQLLLVMARRPQDHRRGRNFAFMVTLSLFSLAAVVAYSPVGDFVLATVIGAPGPVAGEALSALRVMALIPLLMGFRQFYSTLSMHQRRTHEVAAASLARIGVLAALVLGIAPLAAWSGAWVGAVARTGSMAADALISFGLGRRHYGLAPRGASAAPARSTPERRSTRTVVAEHTD